MHRGPLLVSAALLLAGAPAYAGQAPFAAGAADFPLSEKDRVYAAEQFSNTVSVIDPSTNRNLGVIRLGEPVASL
jgi:YVTN family beta-propeller protein